MKIIALSNQKGGVSKSTSTYNLAYLKAKEGKNVLMVDIDPQSSLTILCGMMPGTTEYCICDLFKGKDPFECGYPVEKSGLDNLYIIPSDIELAFTEQELIAKMSREKILKKQLDVFEGTFDYIFIDCPPQLGILNTNALVAATDVIVPAKPEYLAYRGVRALKNTISTVREEFNPELHFDGFLISMYEKTVNDHQSMVEQFKKEGSIIGIVKKGADTYKDVLDGLPVVASRPNTDVAIAYKEIAMKI